MNNCFAAERDIFICALGGIVTLLIFDTLTACALPICTNGGAVSLILIGCSFISLQLSLRQRWDEMLKKVLLGSPSCSGARTVSASSPWVTAMDTLSSSSLSWTWD